jgi:hypothetical protein
VADEITTEDDVSDNTFHYITQVLQANGVFSCLPGRIIFMKPDDVPNFHMHLYLRLDGLLGC